MRKIRWEYVFTNPNLRRVFIGKCEHVVGVSDGVDSRGGSSDAHAAVRRRAPWPKDCKDFIAFAIKEHDVFCKRKKTIGRRL